MRWSYDHDILLCREIIFIKPYRYKAGTKESGNSWSLASQDLNLLLEIVFNTTQKPVRDRYRLLIDKNKKKMREQEGSSFLFSSLAEEGSSAYCQSSCAHTILNMCKHMDISIKRSPQQ